MIRVSIIYNRTDSTTFDYDYYVKTHMTMVGRLSSPVKIEVDKIGPMPDGSPAPIHCLGHIYYKSMEAMENSSTPEGTEELMGDIPNYYKGGQPTILVSEIEEVPI